MFLIVVAKMLASQLTQEYTPSLTAIAEVLLQEQPAVMEFQISDPKQVQVLKFDATPLE